MNTNESNTHHQLPPLGRAGVGSGVDPDHFVSLGITYFKQGYNCSQSVAMAFADYYGIPTATMSRLSASFGGGIGRMRETCGAACAMFMLAGLEVTNEDDRPEPMPLTKSPYPSQQVKKKDYEVVQSLAAAFREQTGSIICRDLLGLTKQRADGTIPEIEIIATPDARTDEYYRKRPCIRMVETAIRIYARYLNEKSKSPVSHGIAVG